MGNPSEMGPELVSRRLATTPSCRRFDPSRPVRESAGFAGISVGGQLSAAKGCASTSEPSPRQGDPKVGDSGEEV